MSSESTQSPGWPRWFDVHAAIAVVILVAAPALYKYLLAQGWFAVAVRRTAGFQAGASASASWSWLIGWVLLTAAVLVLQQAIRKWDKFTVGGADFDWRVTVAVVLSCWLSFTFRYGHSFFGNRAYDQLLLFFAVPLFVVALLFRESPTKYGLGAGKWKEGLIWTAIGVGIMAPILWFLGRTPAMQQYYEQSRGCFPILWNWGVEMLAWEYIWRGFLLFALLRVMGPGPAILIQAIPFAFMHLGKPEFETFTTPIGGACFGFVAWRTNSFLYPCLIHWFMIVFLEMVASGKLG